jgi:hypothetical protein
MVFASTWFSGMGSSPEIKSLLIMTKNSDDGENAMLFVFTDG